MMAVSSPVREPFEVHNSGFNETVEFWGYVRPLPCQIISNLLHRALLNTNTHRTGAIIDTGQMELWDGRVKLHFRPGREMTWRMWMVALWALREFAMAHHMCFEWTFVVLENKIADPDVGYGALIDAWGAKDTDDG